MTNIFVTNFMGCIGGISINKVNLCVFGLDLLQLAMYH